MSQMPFPQFQPAQPGQPYPQQYASGQYPQQPQQYAPQPQQYAPQPQQPPLPPQQQYSAPFDPQAIPAYDVTNAALFSQGASPTAAANLRGGMHTRIAAAGVDVEFPQKNSMTVRFLPGICLGGGHLLPYRSESGSFESEFNGYRDCWFRKYPMWRGGHHKSLAMLCPDMQDGKNGSPIAMLIDAAWQAKRGAFNNPAWASLVEKQPGRGADLGNPKVNVLVRALMYQRVPAQGAGTQYDPPRGTERPMLLVLGDTTWDDFDKWAAANPTQDPIALDQGVFWDVSMNAAQAIQVVAGGQAFGAGGRAGGAGGGVGTPYHLTPCGMTHAATHQPIYPSLTQRGNDFLRQLYSVMLPWDKLLDPPTVEEQVVELIQTFPTDLCLHAWAAKPEWLALPEVQAKKAQPLGMKAQQLGALPPGTVVGAPQPGGFNPYGALPPQGYAPQPGFAPAPAPQFQPGYAPQPPQFQPNFAPPAPAFMAPPPAPVQQQPPQGYAPQPAPAPAFTAPPPAPVQPSYPQGYPQPNAQPAPTPAFMAPPPAPAQQGYPQPNVVPQQPPAFMAPPPAALPGQYGAQPDAGVTAMFGAPPTGAPPVQSAAAALSAYMPQGQ